MKRAAALILLVILMICSVSCNKTEEVKMPGDRSKPSVSSSISPTTAPTPEPTPEQTPETLTMLFMDAAKKLDYDAIRSYCIGETEITESYGKEYEAAFKAVFANCAKELEYNIIDLQENEDTATVQLHCKYADSTPYIEEVIKSAIIESISKTFKGEIKSTDDYIAIAINTMFAKSELLGSEIVENDVSLEFQKIDGIWKILELNDDMKAVITMNFSKTGGALMEYWNY